MSVLLARAEDALAGPYGLPCGGCAPSTDASNTLIILDWDDTILPTSFLAACGYRVDGPDPTADLAAELAGYACHVESMLRTLLALGMVIICTNAETGWVELTCRKFLPGLETLVASIEKISARSEFEPRGVTSPFDWKRYAFSWLLSTRGRSNVLSVGDSVHERAAVIHACSAFGGRGVCCKSLKFLERPGVRELVLQHQKALERLSDYLTYGGHLDLFVQLVDGALASQHDLVIQDYTTGDPNYAQGA